MTTKEPLTAIVTGASTGIGFAIAQRFVSDGLNVVMNARTAADLEAAFDRLGASQNTRFVAGDIADKAVGAMLVATAEEAFGGVDILVNNAGVFRRQAVSRY